MKKTSVKPVKPKKTGKTDLSTPSKAKPLFGKIVKAKKVKR